MKRFRLLFRIFAIIFFLSSPTIVFSQELIMADAYTTASAYKTQIGKQFDFFIPGGNTYWGNVWGTDIYTHDCSIMAAAIHAGIIRPETGGIVTIEIKPGQMSYKGSTRNGISSNDYGQWDGSFVFVKNTLYSSLPKDIIYATWNSQANVYRGKTGQQFTFYLPPTNTIIGTVWGTNVYTDDSYICAAAVHAGLITKEKGGIVTIEMKKGMSAYKSTMQNGILSQSYGEWQSSFTFVNKPAPTGKTDASPAATEENNTVSKEDEPLPAGLTKDYVFVKTDNPEYNLAGFHVNGDQMLVKYDEFNGVLRKIFYKKTDQSEGIYISFDEQQRPYLIETKNIIYRFFDFDGKKASLAVAENGKPVSIRSGVTFDYTPPVPGTELPSGQRGGPTMAPFGNGLDIDANFILKATSYSLSVATCAVATTISAGAALFPCASLFVSTIADGLPNDHPYKKHFESANIAISYLGGVTNFPKTKLVELLENASTSVDAITKVYEGYTTVTSYIQKVKDMDQAIKNWKSDNEKSNAGNKSNNNANSSKNNTETKNPAPDISIPIPDGNASYAIVDLRTKKWEEEMKDRLEELGKRNFALTSMADLFINVGHRVHYILPDDGHNDDKLMSQLRVKEKEGYRLVYLLLQPLFMKIDGYDEPVEHKLIKDKNSSSRTISKNNLLQQINNYAEQGYEPVRVICTNQFSMLFYKVAGAVAKIDQVIEIDSFLTDQKVAQLASKGYLANKPAVVFTEYGNIIFKKTDGKSYESKQIVLPENKDGKTNMDDLVSNLLSISKTANKYAAEGYYINFAHILHKKIYIYLYK